MQTKVTSIYCFIPSTLANVKINKTKKSKTAIASSGKGTKMQVTVLVEVNFYSPPF